MNPNKRRFVSYAKEEIEMYPVDDLFEREEICSRMIARSRAAKGLPSLSGEELADAAIIWAEDTKNIPFDDLENICVQAMRNHQSNSAFGVPEICQQWRISGNKNSSQNNGFISIDTIKLQREIDEYYESERLGETEFNKLTSEQQIELINQEISACHNSEFAEKFARFDDDQLYQHALNQVKKKLVINAGKNADSCLPIKKVVVNR